MRETRNNNMEYHKKEAKIKSDNFYNKMHITFMFASPLKCLNQPIKDEISFKEEWDLLK
jgi:hypothetical protein